MADGAGVMGAEGGLAMGTGIDFITSKDEWGRCGFEKRYESISCRVADLRPMLPVSLLGPNVMRH